MVAFARFPATHPPKLAGDARPVIAPVDSTVLVVSFRDFFPPEVWERLIATAERVEFSAGTVLMRRGDAGPSLHVIEEGTFEVVDARSSPETVLNVLGPGHVIGDMSFIDRAPASAEVRARSHVTCLVWQPALLMGQLDAEPDLALPFYRALATTVTARARTVMSAALAGGFGVSAPTRERTEAADHDRVAYALAFDLLDLLAAGGSETSAQRAAYLAEALTATCRWFTVAGEAGRGVGVRLRELLGEVLSSSATTAAMLARPEGSPAGPQLFRHVLSGRPEGRYPAGIRFDAALLQLPTFRGWRWRDQALAGALADALPPTGARVLGISLTGAPISEAQLAVLRARGGHVTSVQLGPRAEATESPPGITRTTVVADLPSLLRGTGPTVGGVHDAVLVDRVSDVLPDEVLRALLTWARSQLRDRGQLIVGHAIPSDDVELLDQLLRWPSLPRRTSAVVALLPRGGHPSTLAPGDDEAAGLITWRAQP